MISDYIYKKRLAVRGQKKELPLEKWMKVRLVRTGAVGEIVAIGYKSYFDYLIRVRGKTAWVKQNEVSIYLPEN